MKLHKKFEKRAEESVFDMNIKYSSRDSEGLISAHLTIVDEEFVGTGYSKFCAAIDLFITITEYYAAAKEKASLENILPKPTKKK